MKECGILFSAPMVRAILAGTKTQTRRVVGSLSKRHPLVNLAEHAGYGGEGYSGRFDDPHSWGWAYAEDGVHAPLGSWLEWCPYGQPGEKLWVRETGWERPERTARMLREGADTWAPYYYDADGLSEGEHEQFKAWGFKRRPSIHMPRWASRITLEITGVRVERLQSIDDNGAIAEGAEQVGDINVAFVAGFKHLWESLNGPGSWSANPWVWVISFRRLP